jgi:hypothetical protein
MYQELKLVLFRKMTMSKYVNNSYLPPMAAAGKDGVTYDGSHNYHRNLIANI